LEIILSEVVQLQMRIDPASPGTGPRKPEPLAKANRGHAQGGIGPELPVLSPLGTLKPLQGNPRESCLRSCHIETIESKPDRHGWSFAGGGGRNPFVSDQKGPIAEGKRAERTLIIPASVLPVGKSLVEVGAVVEALGAVQGIGRESEQELGLL
jgi:hypothetical protein